METASVLAESCMGWNPRFLAGIGMASVLHVTQVTLRFSKTRIKFEDNQKTSQLLILICRTTRKEEKEKER